MPSSTRGAPRNLGWKHKNPKSFFNLYLHGDPYAWDPTKLHVAVKDGDINRVRDILKVKKGLVHARDQSGRTALHWTVVLGTRACTKTILKHTSWWYLDRGDYNGCTALHYAAQAGRSDEARMLLNRGAYANARDHHGRTPVHYAALTGNPFIIQKLHSHGANLWMRDKDGHLAIDLTEDHAVMDLLDRMMEPGLCFGICTGSKERCTHGDADRYPYHEEGNTVKRVLPKNMLREKMLADGSRKKHSLVHKEIEQKTMAKMDTRAEARAKDKALDELLIRMQQMKEDDLERERLQRLKWEQERGL